MASCGQSVNCQELKEGRGSIYVPLLNYRRQHKSIRPVILNVRAAARGGSQRKTNQDRWSIQRHLWHEADFSVYLSGRIDHGQAFVLPPLGNEFGMAACAWLEAGGTGNPVLTDRSGP